MARELIDELKAKIAITDSNEKKVKILTLAPLSWTIEKTAQEFNVSIYMVKKARSVRKQHGILADTLPSKKGKELPQTTIDKVLAFYESDEFSRMCPGKDSVSVKVNGQKLQKQKRLLLINLKEMHEQFKEKEPQHKIGFSKFCELRPRWCVTVTSRGSHSVCVCAIHQNVKLMVAALERFGTTDYKELIVCDITSTNCMIH